MDGWSGIDRMEYVDALLVVLHVDATENRLKSGKKTGTVVPGEDGGKEKKGGKWLPAVVWR